MSNRDLLLPLLSCLLFAPVTGSGAAQVASVVRVTASPNPIVQGQYIGFAAGVNAVGSAWPTGTIELTDSCNGAAPVPLGTISLSPASSPNPGSGSLSTTLTCIGANSVVGSYSGDTNYAAASSAQLVITVLGQFTPTTVSLALSESGQSVTFAATLAFATTENTPPTGTITFTDLNTSNVLSVSKVTTSGGGKGGGSATGASFTTSSLAAGSYSVQATYSGDNIYSGSVSNTVNVQGTSAPTAPSIRTTSGVISASGFGQFPAIAPGTWVEIYGSNLAAKTRSWTAADFNNNTAPTSLEGTSVTIGNQPAFIYYVSPGQVNAQVPSNLATGSQQVIVKTISGGASAPVSVTVAPVQPGLLALPSFAFGGQQYAVATFGDGSFVLPPGAIPGVNSQRARPGDEIVFWGIGFGPVVPDVPAGQIVSQQNTIASSVQFSFGNTPATLRYWGLAPGEVGLYQFNAIVPNVTPSDLVPLTFTLGGTGGTQTLYVAVGN